MLEETDVPNDLLEALMVKWRHLVPADRVGLKC